MNPFAAPMLLGLAGNFLSERAERETERYRTGGEEGNYTLAGLTDALACPGIDLEKYQSECRAKVFRDAWNHWKLLRTTADGITEAELDTAARALLTMVNRDAEGKIRQVEVAIGKKANPWGTPVLESRNSVCMTPMTLRASEYSPAYHEVFVRFVYRGVENDLLWPAYKVGAAGAAQQVLGVRCPTNADWLLDAVYTPSQVEVPAEKDDSLLPPLHEKGTDALDPDLDFSTKIALGGAGLLAVAVLAGYAVRSIR